LGQKSNQKWSDFDTLWYVFDTVWDVFDMLWDVFDMVVGCQPNPEETMPDSSEAPHKGQ
jgi:hypothetical protein